jgi:hypothetical protein
MNGLRLHIFECAGGFGWEINSSGKNVCYSVPSGGLPYPTKDAARCAALSVGWVEALDGTVYFDDLRLPGKF